MTEITPAEFTLAFAQHYPAAEQGGFYSTDPEIVKLAYEYSQSIDPDTGGYRMAADDLFFEATGQANWFEQRRRAYGDTVFDEFDDSDCYSVFTKVGCLLMVNREFVSIETHSQFMARSAAMAAVQATNRVIDSYRSGAKVEPK